MNISLGALIVLVLGLVLSGCGGSDPEHNTQTHSRTYQWGMKHAATVMREADSESRALAFAAVPVDTPEKVSTSFRTYLVSDDKNKDWMFLTHIIKGPEDALEKSTRPKGVDPPPVVWAVVCEEVNRAGCKELAERHTPALGAGLVEVYEYPAIDQQRAIFAYCMPGIGDQEAEAKFWEGWKQGKACTLPAWAKELEWRPFRYSDVKDLS